MNANEKRKKNIESARVIYDSVIEQNKFLSSEGEKKYPEKYNLIPSLMALLGITRRTAQEYIQVIELDSEYLKGL